VRASIASSFFVVFIRRWRRRRYKKNASPARATTTIVAITKPMVTDFEWDVYDREEKDDDSDEVPSSYLKDNK